MVLGLDPDEDGAGTFNTTTDACSPLTNGAAVTGKIALVDRGACAFTIKVKNAQNAGAIGVIIGNTLGRGAFGMVGTDPTITISSVGISEADRNRIVGGLAGGPVNVTMKDASGAEKTSSFRWLVGEKSTAFGGAIRDMWNPTCYGDPGKVSDAEYHCDTSDQGGVHSNSGVPNHGYALLADGGTYNGVTVPSIGLTKASHLYYQAMTQHQTPTSDFTDHADALAASCTELTGQTVEGLSTAGSPEDTNAPAPLADEVINASDCAAVNLMAQAVELRKEPTQCNFQPLLAKNAPAVCGPGTKQNVVYKETFSNGLGDWTRSSESVFGGKNFPWRTLDTADLTGPLTEPVKSHSGNVAYGPAPDEGDCSGTASDISGADSITSQPIVIPGSRQKSARLTFQHYVATENGYDGGNVKASVNGGGFEVIPASAYIFNKPTRIFSEAEGNTNPLSGEEGFTGTDGGKVAGSWGQSQIDLTQLGIGSGDDVRLRFDIGRDGCGGIDGWYVDNVKVSTCKAKSKVDAVQRPKPSTFGKSAKVIVKVSGDGVAGTPEGVVALKGAGGRSFGTKRLFDGRTVFTLPKTLRPNRYNMVATYRGNDIWASDQDRFVLVVKRG